MTSRKRLCSPEEAMRTKFELIMTAAYVALTLTAGCAATSVTPASGPAPGVREEPHTTETSSSSKESAQVMPKPLYVLSYVAGPAWKKGKPPGEQDFAGHFAY